MKLIQLIKRIWYWNRSTKIELWSTENIGYHGGYYECHNERHIVTMQWYKDLKNLPYEECKRLLNERFDIIERRYFGPKWIKKGSK